MSELYPYPNKALVKALYNALRAHEITLAEWSAMMRASVLYPDRKGGSAYEVVRG